jgi:murein DD-endopeptidase MepM/ murein hydrolase activator NlpD
MPVILFTALVIGPLVVGPSAIRPLSVVFGSCALAVSVLVGAPSAGPATPVSSAVVSAQLAAPQAADRTHDASLAQPAGTPARQPLAWRWPLTAATVVRGFAPGPYRWSPGHRGVDLRAAAGAPVLSAGPGIVTYAGVLAGRGVLVVSHPTGVRTTYEPVLATVQVGAQVRAGQVVGRLGPGGHCPPDHCLHWGALRGSTYLDPLSLLGVRLVAILLPQRSGGP